MNPSAQTGQGPEGDGDDEFLDAAFEAALARLSCGGVVSAEEFVVQKPALAEQITGLLALAQRVAAPGVLPARPPLPAIAGFQILRELGRGGMGTVYVARQEPLGRTVALKVLLGAESLSGNARRRFLHEARVLAQISHPHVVQIHQVVEQDGICAFAMELIEGKSLAEMIAAVQGGPETERLALAGVALGADLESDRSWTGFVLRVGAEVAEALAQVHSQGLVHRDVKPSNILVRRDGKAMLADFGLVRDQGSQGLTGAGHFLGTLPYAAPEQLRGHHHAVDARTDVYSLGITLYQASTLRLPFSATSTAHLLARIETGAAPSLRKVDRGLPRDLELVVGKAMDPDRARRYAGAAELAQELRAVLELRPVRAQRAGKVLRARRWVQRHPTRASALLISALSLATAAGLLRMAAQASALLAQIPTDRLLMNALLEETPSLLPGGSGRIAAMELWLGQARSVQDRGDERETLRAEIEARGRPQDAANAAAEAVRVEQLESDLARDRKRIEVLRQALNSPGGDTMYWWNWDTVWLNSLTQQIEATKLGLSRRRTVAFAVAEDERLFGLLEEIRSLSVRLDADVQRVAVRLGAAREDAALEEEALGTTWPHARELAAVTRYGGMVLTPQPGLLPLGADPESGLLEFTHLQSGEPPVRDPSTGRLRIDEKTGLVFVLIPGGKARVGARLPGTDDTDGTNWCDRSAADEEQPLSELTLDPFFLSKFEMTQAQWQRVTGRNPSWFQVGQEIDGRTVTGLHPVDSVTWEMALGVLETLGLVLPTDAQWEHACRGGTSTRYWTGVDVESLEGAENVGDAGSELRAGHKREDVEARIRSSERVAWDDHWLRHAPVGTFRPNPFGLFDVSGNVGEWCQETGMPNCCWLQFPARPGDGLRQTPLGSFVILIRGGTFRWSPWQARASARMSSGPNHPVWFHGVRPARRLSR